MSKKIKGVAFESSPRVSYEDARARFKHQTLLQDYLELQQETEAARIKLEAIKQKKKTLEAEVRFLRRRYKFLIKTKTSTPQMKSMNVETTRYRKSKKDKANPTKAAALCNLPPIPNLNHRGRVYTEKKNVTQSNRPLVFDWNQNENLDGVNLNQRVSGNNSSPMTEVNQKNSGLDGKEAVRQTQIPIFDLNQISIEEEEELRESFEEQRKEQYNDLKLSICRNNSDGSTNRSGKRKISWQDPVAVRV